ncbi:MAG: DUF1775 domain-containing protein [Gemmatimonadaceae bacterium]
MTRNTRSWGVVALVMVLIPATLNAHAVVYPPTSRPGAYERYVLRVPNESDAATISVSITFPSTIRVISFLDVPGWRIDARMDSSGRATSATWTGTLPAERFVELPFIGVNPDQPATITWPVVQVYANGDTVRWTGAPDSNTPASRTEIAASGAKDGDDTGLDEVLPSVAAGLALLLSIVALLRTRAARS